MTNSSKKQPLSVITDTAIQSYRPPDRTDSFLEIQKMTKKKYEKCSDDELYGHVKEQSSLLCVLLDEVERYRSSDSFSSITEAIDPDQPNQEDENELTSLDELEDEITQLHGETVGDLETEDFLRALAELQADAANSRD